MRLLVLPSTNVCRVVKDTIKYILAVKGKHTLSVGNVMHERI